MCALWLAILGAACRSASGPAPDPRDVGDGETLTRVVAELRMHLRDDTYRQPRPLTGDGRDLFEAILWKLDRLQRERGLEPEGWQNVDYVIELARARVLEKMRRYAEAQAAYARVAERSSALQQAATEGRDGIARLAAIAAASSEPTTDELAWLEERVRLWTELAWELRATRWESLAREEAEAGEMLRVERLATAGQLDAAIEAARRLAEHHRHSKLYARHLIALGDLNADAARALEVAKLARSAKGEVEARRDALLEHAFSAYELASEARSADDRLAALARIEALRADREGGLAHAP
jgi:polyhydroxyalkanoate synthesis regulator phasin